MRIDAGPQLSLPLDQRALDVQCFESRNRP